MPVGMKCVHWNRWPYCVILHIRSEGRWVVWEWKATVGPISDEKISGSLTIPAANVRCWSEFAEAFRELVECFIIRIGEEFWNIEFFELDRAIYIIF